MTPKQQYDERRRLRKLNAENEKAKQHRDYNDDRRQVVEIIDILDRFATAVERIADAMESTRPTGGQHE